MPTKASGLGLGWEPDRLGTGMKAMESAPGGESRVGDGRAEIFALTFSAG